MNPILRFLASLRSLRNSGAIKTIDQAFDFAKREFGEIDDLFKRQIEQIFKGPVKKAPKPGEGGITSIKNAPKKETPVQEPGTSPVMQRLEKGVETLKQMKQPGMDLTTGLTKTIARSILSKKGIQVPERVDPIEVLTQNFGADVLMDAKNVAEELIELQRMGKSTKSIDEVLEQSGMFDIKINPDAPKGMSDEQLQQIKKEVDQEKMFEDFDPTDRKPNSMGGLNRTNFATGTKLIMAIINAVKKLKPMDAMKEVNKVIAREGKYKNLSDEQVQKIFDDTNDHIFERDVKPKETDVNFDDEVDIEKGLNDLDEINVTKDAVRVKKMLDDVDETYGVTPDMKKELDEMAKLTPKAAERFELKMKYPGLDENLLTSIVEETDPQKKAEVIATIEQAFELMRRGKSPDEILAIFKKATDRTKQATGGLSYLMGM